MERTTRPELPAVSVCIPTRNGRRTIGGQIAALAAQDYAGRFEVIVADNGSTDATIDAVHRAAPEGLRVRVVDASRGRGTNVARNSAAAVATGGFLAFCDDDDEVRPGWLTALVAAAQRGDIVCGVIDSERLNDEVVRSWKSDRARDRLVAAHGMMPSIIGASCGIWADTFAAVGGFDESMVSGHDDVEFGWRVQLSGHRLVFAPDAVVDYRYRDSIVAMGRQNITRYRSAAKLVARYRPLIGQEPTTARGGERQVLALIGGLPRALVDRSARGRWVYVATKGLGWIIGTMLLRVDTRVAPPEIAW